MNPPSPWGPTPFPLLTDQDREFSSQVAAWAAKWAVVVNVDYRLKEEERQQYITNMRQADIDRMSCVMGTAVQHNAGEAMADLPYFLSPYVVHYAPVRDLDDVFGGYLKAQAKAHQVWLNRLALRDRLTRAKADLEKRQGKKLRGEIDMSMRDLHADEIAYITAKQFFDSSENILQQALDDEAMAKEAYGDAKAVVDKALTAAAKELPRQRRV